jgi:hypothetical protein
MDFMINLRRDPILKVGDYVKVIYVPAGIDTTGREGTIVEISHKIKIDFDEQWCGYYLPNQLERIK